MKHFKFLLLFSIFVLCFVSSSVDAIEAGVNADIVNETGQDANDFHMRGRIKSGWPGLNWADPPKLAYSINGPFPNFTIDIQKDLNSLGQNEYTFEAKWDGVLVSPDETIHIGLFFDLYCNNLIIELEAWWTFNGRRVGMVKIPGFVVNDTGIDPTNPDGGPSLPSHIQVRDESNAGTPQLLHKMDLAVVKEWMIYEYFQGDPNRLFELLSKENEDQLNNLVEERWASVEIENPIPFAADSFFDVFFDIEIPTEEGLAPLEDVLRPGDLLINRVVVVDFPGEPEDQWSWTWHLHRTHGLDFGDAPEDPPVGYPTTVGSGMNGARHIIQGPWFGPRDDRPDHEPWDGQPDPLALGDDNWDGNDDEDGIIIPPLTPGVDNTIDIEVSNGGGWVNGWIDYNKNLNWSAAEMVVDQYLPDGVHSVTFTVPASALEGETFARFRIVASTAGATGGIDSPVGLAHSGEVEDHEVKILPAPKELDWGDAPDNPDGTAGYPTRAINNGANHIIGGPWLGTDDDNPDADDDGQPTNSADGDDLDSDGDDEDGVQIPILIGGKSEEIKFEVSGGGGYVTGWIDYDQSMSWELGELVVNGGYPDGVHSVTVDVPCDSVYGKTYARFRIMAPDVIPTTPTPEGPAPNGEVEDYILEIKDPCYWPLDADINGDGVVDLIDFSIMANQWLNGVTPS